MTESLVNHFVKIGCPFCGHAMLDHLHFRGNYEEPEPYVECCDGTINPRTLTTCRCEHHPSRFTAEQLAAID